MGICRIVTLGIIVKDYVCGSSLQRPSISTHVLLTLSSLGLKVVVWSIASFVVAFLVVNLLITVNVRISVCINKLTFL